MVLTGRSTRAVESSEISIVIYFEVLAYLLLILNESNGGFLNPTATCRCLRMGDFRVMFKLENGEYRGKNKLRLRLGLSSRAKDHLKPITHPKLLDLSKRRFLTRFLLSRSPSPSSIELGSSSDKPTKWVVSEWLSPNISLKQSRTSLRILPPVVGVYHPTTASLATDTPFSVPVSGSHSRLSLLISGYLESNITLVAWCHNASIHGIRTIFLCELLKSFTLGVCWQSPDTGFWLEYPEPTHYWWNLCSKSFGCGCINHS